MSAMLAKLTSRHRITLPQRALDALGPEPVPSYFEIEVQHGRIVLTPVGMGSADAVRRQLAEIGITEGDIADAVAEARHRS
jgi:bifunctional DNA-binding transcriptional regulator/antitoxin component of YhaV-PrlF toxin-antitoxin module